MGHRKLVFLLALVVGTLAFSGGISVGFSGVASATGTPAYSVSPTPVAFGETTIHGTKAKTVTLKNTGTTVLQFKVSFDVAVFTRTGGTCINSSGSMARNIGPHASCTVDLAFTPVAPGNASGTMTVVGLPGTGSADTYTGYGTGTGPTKHVTLRGTGVYLTASASPDPVSFGDVNVADSGFRVVTLTNTSDVSVQVYSWVIGAAEFAEEPLPPLPAGACSQPGGEGGRTYLVVPKGGQCTVGVSFSPDAAGARTGEVDFEVSRTDQPVGQYRAIDGDNELTKAVYLSGKGVVPPFTVPGSHAFGTDTVGTTKRATIVVKNTSTGALDFWPSGPSDPSFSWSGSAAHSCVESDIYGYTQHPVRIPPGDSCSIDVVFHRDDLGKATGTLQVGAYHPAAPPVTGGPGGQLLATASVELTGTAAAPTFTASPTAASFGNVTVGRTVSKVVTLKNTSSVPVQFWPGPHGEQVFTASATAGANPCATYDMSGFLLIPVDVAPGASCTIGVTYTARTLGHLSSQVVVDVYGYGDYTGPGGPKLATKNIGASGTGIAPTFTVARTPVAYGDLTVGATTTRTLTVTNTSQIPLMFDPSTPAETVFGSSPVGGDQSCASYSDFGGALEYAAVAPGDSCTLTGTFSPDELGAVSSGMTVTAYDPVDVLTPFGPARATKSFRVSGKGVPATITVSPKSLSFGQVPVNTFKSLPLTVTNTSDIPLEMHTLSADGSPFQAYAGGGANACAELGPLGGDEPVLVAPGGHCTITVAFSPTSRGYESGGVGIAAYRGHTELGYPSGPLQASAVVNTTGTGK